MSCDPVWAQAFRVSLCATPMRQSRAFLKADADERGFGTLVHFVEAAQF